MEKRQENTHSTRRISKLKSVLILTSIYFVVQVIAAISTRSLALLADAGHMLADVAGLALVIFAINYARKPATVQHTYGFYRVEILAALLNGVVLILISLYILYEAYRRVFEPPEIQGLPMIIVAAIGLGVNFTGIRMLGSNGHIHGGSQVDIHDDTAKEHEDLSVKSAYLEVLNDTFGAAGVIAAGVIILITRFYLADPLISIGLALLILLRTWSFIKKSIHILMEGVPANISPEEVKNSILEIKGVTGVFDLHIWTITSGINAVSGHVVVIDRSRSQTVLQDINAILEKKFKINHATIQIESYHSEPD
ncbi:MAG TPA: cation diffusion facilitator family transporter [Candidatus Nitrosopolaris sp.]|nr:cation diffusion facilitator family transporter [Candidatus Nitrosopolaris sp.]